MLDKILWLVLLTFIPSMELRLSIPVGMYSKGLIIPFFGEIMGFGLDPLTVFIVCVGANIILGPIAYVFMGKIINIFLKIRLIKRLYDWFVSKLDKKRALVEKYGVLGVIVLVGVPLPGSGSWNGALISNIVGIDFKKYLIGNTIGVIIAGIIVTVLTMLVLQAI